MFIKTIHKSGIQTFGLLLVIAGAGAALLAWPGAPYVYDYKNRPGNMLILTETGFQVHYDHYEVGLSDNDFLPVTNKAGESYRYLALV